MGARCCSDGIQTSCDKTVCDRDAHAFSVPTNRKDTSSECEPGLVSKDTAGTVQRGASFGFVMKDALGPEVVLPSSVSPLVSARSARASKLRTGVSFHEPEPDVAPHERQPANVVSSEPGFFDACLIPPTCASEIEGDFKKPAVSKSDISTSTFSSEMPMTCSERVDVILNNSISWSLFVCVLTIWALFADDIRILCLPKSVDTVFRIINLCILFIFVIEFGLCNLVQYGYACSLRALMDLLAAISLIPFEEILRGIEGVGSSISVARVARAARAIRILRAARAAVMALKTEAKVRRMRRLVNRGEVSVLGDTLIQDTNIKVILGMLVLLIGTALIAVDETDRVTESGLEILDLIYEQDYMPSPTAVNLSSQWTGMWHDYRRTVEGIDEDSLRKLVKLQVWGVTYLSLPTNDLRDTDLKEFVVGGDRLSQLHSLAIVSAEELSKTQSVKSLILTTFSVFVIILWGWSFGRDHRKLVLDPVQRMIRLLKDMTVDPRKAMDHDHTNSNKYGHEMTEMELVESCLGKFGGLLKVGFGEAGMNIISQNMNQANFDPVAPGVLVQAIFGFCDIRNFTDCCEVLNEDTLIYTNRIAHIVHSVVVDSGGCVNKNIGDAFLSVWKLNQVEDEAQCDPLWHTTSSDGSHIRKRTMFSHHLNGNLDICDSSLHAFLKMNELMNSSDAIQELSADTRLQRKLPGYKVRLGSGLHLGWAIEGAVGTSHKVDATYLSPHVNMAARLEAATKQYGVSILMSESLVHQFGEQLRSECRPVDRVTVKGSAQPLLLYVHMPSESSELSDSERQRFMLLWTSAFELYLSGTDWASAAVLMARCLEIRPTDKPAKVLLDVIEQAGGRAPQKWNGYRELTEK